MDLFDKIEKNRGPLGKYMEVAEGYYMFPKLEGEIGPHMKFQGKDMIIWSLNNYLGLANHPEVREADTKGTAEYGLAYPMGARMMSGQTTLHEQFEQELAEMVGKESAFVVNYGYQGIMSAIDTILDPRGRDVIVYDEESHACIIDGARMYPGKRFKFKHNDIEDLDKQLARATKIVEENGVGGILVISEGVFGMRGDQGKLHEIVALKSKYQFRFLVDDAHGFGTLGKTGAGAGEEQDCQDGIDIYFSTFAKSMAMIGGFLAADKDVMDFLRYNMRSQIFAKSLPMPFVVGGLKRLELLKKHPELKDKLWENVNYLQNGLRDRGFDCGDTNTCVTPVYMKGEVEEAMAMVYDLRENYGIFCSIVVYPVIPKGMIILRLIPTAAHSKEDIDKSLAAFEAVSHKLTAGMYRPAVAAE
jgi:glycine C-acetyltransferase